MNINTLSKLHYDILRPSGLSILVSVTFTGLIILANSFASLREKMQIDVWNFDLREIIFGSLSDFLTGLIGQQAADAIVLGLIWAVVGLLVYMAMYGISRIITELGHDLEEMHFIWPKGTDRRRPVIDLIKRVSFQIIAGIILFSYIFNIGDLLLTYRLPSIFGLDGFDSNPFVKAAVFIIIAMLLLHLLVVLLRLTTLKRRVFGD